MSCHTRENGKPFAGSRPIETPFGTIYSPNITPDRDTGIGAWSDDDFYRAMHAGIGPDGKRLYPAFPYPYFTKMTRDDVLAIRAYLNTLPAVSRRRPDPDLTWPLQHRVFMRGWDWLFFKEGSFAPDPQKSAEWNRGAYLVEGAGHCGACHTPKNVLGGDKTSEAAARQCDPELVRAETWPTIGARGSADGASTRLSNISRPAATRTAARPV